MVDASGVHADPVYPIDFLSGFNPANRQAKVMSEFSGAAETPTSGLALSGRNIPSLTFMYGMT